MKRDGGQGFLVSVRSGRAMVWPLRSGIKNSTASLSYQRANGRYEGRAKMYLKKSVKVGEQELSVETGRMAKQADGSVLVRVGDTMLLVTAVSAREKRDVDFLPLTVEYQERLYAAGRIPGSYFK